MVCTNLRALYSGADFSSFCVFKVYNLVGHEGGFDYCIYAWNFQMIFPFCGMEFGAVGLE